MAEPQGYILSQEDIRVIRSLYFRFGRLQHYTNAFGRPPEDYLDHEEFHTTEFHIAFTPTGGIPGLNYLNSTGDGHVPGSADCQIFRIDPNGATANDTEAVTGYTQKVYNLSSEPVSGEAWITVTRDKYGNWVVSGTPATGLTCFPAELVSTYDPCLGYNAKRMIIRDDGGYDEHPSGFRTDYVYTPDEDETLQPLTRGWLCPSPDNALDTGTGTCVGGTGTADENQRWIFIPVLKWRTTCDDGALEWQYSTDGGVTWITEEILGVDCGTGTGTNDPTAITIGGCGWVSGLREENCLVMTVVSTSGRCLCIDDSQQLFLCWDNLVGAWESGYCTTGTAGTGTADDEFLICGNGTAHESGRVLFWIDATGIPKATINGEYLVWDKCGVDGNGDLFIDFSGGSENLCGTADITECAPSYFTVRFRCVECPTHWYCVVETGGDCNGTGTANEKTVLELTPYEAEVLGDLVCAGPYATEAEATNACNTGETCEQAIVLPDASPYVISIPAEIGTFHYYFRTGTPTIGGQDFYTEINITGDFATSSGTIDGSLQYTLNEPGNLGCNSLNFIYDTCDCNGINPCCVDTTTAAQPPADAYLYFVITVINFDGVGGVMSVELGQGTC